MPEIRVANPEMLLRELFLKTVVTCLVHAEQGCSASGAVPLGLDCLHCGVPVFFRVFEAADAAAGELGHLLIINISVLVYLLFPLSPLGG